MIQPKTAQLVFKLVRHGSYYYKVNKHDARRYASSRLGRYRRGRSTLLGRSRIFTIVAVLIIFMIMGSAATAVVALLVLLLTYLLMLLLQ